MIGPSIERVITLRSPMELRGVVDDAMDQQRPILHEPEHGIPPGVLRCFALFLLFPAAAGRPAGLPNVAACGGDENAVLQAEKPHDKRA